jgi:DNA-binding response OmpR family regulator
MEDQVKVLIADDDPDARIALQRAFADGENGFQAHNAPCGTTAMLQFGLFRPDVIVLGVQNGDSSCWDTLERVRELSTVPVIALSSMDEPELRIKSLKLGADHCVSKPVGFPELCARARALVRRDQRPDGGNLQPQQMPA